MMWDKVGVVAEARSQCGSRLIGNKPRYIHVFSYRCVYGE